MTTQASSGWSISLLGSMSVQKDGDPITGFRTQKSKWLLALLVLRHREPMEYEVLGTLLWPGVNEENARASVRQCVRNLSTLLGSDRIRKFSRSKVGLDLTHVYVDVFAFDTATARRDLASLREAVRLYKGDLLEGCQEEWVHTEREVRWQEYQTALEILVEQAQASGDYIEAERYLRLAVAADGLMEAKRCSLMRLLARRGEYNAAIDVYHQFRSLLQDPHAQPGEEITRLWREIREKVSQAKTKALVSQNVNPVPPIYAIPFPLRALVGRQEAVVEIMSLFTFGRLVTLKGPPGIGKTQLALQVAVHLREDYPDGAVFVDLTEVKNVERIWHAVASVLQIPEQPQRSWDETVLGHLASRQMLLVLDNCEHLVEAGASVVRELLYTCPYLRVLATGRRAWNTIEGERVYTVPPLTLPDVTLLKRLPADPLPDLSVFTAIRLFLERTAEIMPAFALTAQNARTVAQICRRLDGVPLAIHLAAGWMQTLAPEQILARLLEGLEVLRNTRQGTPVRHRQLLTTLEASYQLLSPPLQCLFRRLSVFQSGWSLEAAEAVCETPRLLDSLRQLQERSLVEAEVDGAAIRFRLLETLRQYGGRLLKETNEVATFRHRHLDCFLRVAEMAEPDMVGPRQQIVLAQLEREFGNLTGALEWAYETREVEKGLRLAGAIWRFWYVRGDYQDGLFWLERLLRQESKITVPVRSKALNAAGNLAYQRQEYVQARALFQERLELEQTQGNLRGVASALGGLANVSSALGDYMQTRSLFERALTYFRDLDDTRGIVMTLGNLAVVACKEGDFSRACACHEESIAFFRAAGDLQNLATALNNLADARMSLQEIPVAISALRESLELGRSLESRHSLAHGLTLAFCLTAQYGPLEQAAVLLGAHNAFRERAQLPLPAQAMEMYQRNAGHLLAGLGGEGLDQAHARGRLLSLEETIDYALTSIALSSPQ